MAVYGDVTLNNFDCLIALDYFVSVDIYSFGKILIDPLLGWGFQLFSYIKIAPKAVFRYSE